MSVKSTEAQHAHAKGIDTLSSSDVLSILLDGQIEAAASVRPAMADIEKAAGLAAETLGRGGRLVYAGAGSSGLMAMADGLELPGTYGIDRDRIVILLAGGMASLVDLAGGYEDDPALGLTDAERAGLSSGDCVICVSASGSTPYALAVAEAARKSGSRLIAIANNANAPLFDHSDCAILLQTPPEVISGSTRMGAGTAQKIAFNMFSTLLGIRLGHVMDGLMVNVRADNGKLRDRSARIVANISGIDPAKAKQFLDEAAGSTKIAVLLASGIASRKDAERLLSATGNNLRHALERSVQSGATTS